MGVGYPLDLVVCTALGVDMYDCVYPTRTARFGTALVPEGTLKLRNQSCKNCLLPIDARCTCSTCKHHTRSSLNYLFSENTTLAGQLLTVHNIAHMMQLVRGMRQAVMEERYPAFVLHFLRLQFPQQQQKKVPNWVVEALLAVQIDVSKEKDLDVEAAAAVVVEEAVAVAVAEEVVVHAKAEVVGVESPAKRARTGL